MSLKKRTWVDHPIALPHAGERTETAQAVLTEGAHAKAHFVAGP